MQATGKAVNKSTMLKVATSVKSRQPHGVGAIGVFENHWR
jgi:hypothetical protein